jgi:hypothetical protein
MSDSIPDLLQALEHALDQVDRLSIVLRQSLEAHQRGEHLPEATVAEYRATASLRA